MTEEQSRLAADYFPVALAIARMLAKRCPGLRAEIESAAAEGLCVAAQQYDPSRGVPFTAWARRRTIGSCIDVQREQQLRGYKRAQSLAHPDAPTVLSIDAAVGDTEGISYAEQLPSRDEPVGWEIESMDSVEAMVRPLGSFERHVIMEYYVYGLNQSEIAKKLRCDRTWVNRMHLVALAKIRDWMPKGIAS